MVKSVCLSLLLLLWWGVSHAAIISSYDFDYSLSDTLRVGPDLEALDGVLGANGYEFSESLGLRASGLLPSVEDYAIELGFRVTDSVASYNKLIDFQELGSDYGLYIYSGSLQFYGAGSNVGKIAVDSDVVVGITRQDQKIGLYIDNVLLGSFRDSGRAVSSSNVLYFFVDDSITRQSESVSGTLDFIRIHEDNSTFGTQPALLAPQGQRSLNGTTPVPLPATLWLMLAGLAGLLGMTRRSHPFSTKQFAE